jgi:hypothetical protein
MQRLTVRRPSAALVIATAALVVALTGTGYAALKIPKNSVGTKQLKNNSVTSAKIADGQVAMADLANNSVTGGKIVDGSITFGDARRGQFVHGPGSTFTMSADVADLATTQIGTLSGFGAVTGGCASGNVGQNQFTVHDGQTAGLTVAALVPGATGASPLTAAPGADVTSDLGRDVSVPATTVSSLLVTTGASVATLQVWITDYGTTCHFTVQGVSNVS